MMWRSPFIVEAMDIESMSFSLAVNPLFLFLSLFFAVDHFECVQVVVEVMSVGRPLSASSHCQLDGIEQSNPIWIAM